MFFPKKVASHLFSPSLNSSTTYSEEITDYKVSGWMSGRGRTRYSNFSKRSYRCTPSMQKLPVGGLVFFWVQILDQLYPAHRVLKASVDCSEDLRDGGLGHKPATGSRSTLPRALLPSTARDRFLFVLRCEPGQPGTQQPPEPAALLAARRRVWRGAASGQPSRP